MMRWLDSIPLLLLIALAAWMGVAPITPEPHLIEKLRMLGNGTLTRPLDIFPPDAGHLLTARASQQSGLEIGGDHGITDLAHGSEPCRQLLTL